MSEDVPPLGFDSPTAEYKAVETTELGGASPGNTPRMEDGHKKHSYGEPPAEIFQVRGPSYLEDGIKIASAPAAMQLLGCDMFTTTFRTDHVAAMPGGLMERLRAKGHNEFMFLVNIQAPCGTWGTKYVSQISYWTLRPGVAEEDPRFMKLLKIIMDATDEERDKRMKMVPNIRVGPWVVRKCVGSKPVILGTKLKQRYFKGPNYFEIDVDVGSSSVAKRVTGVAAGASKSLVVDMAWVIEGQAPEELPERLLGAIRLAHINMSAPPVLEEHWDVGPTE